MDARPGSRPRRVLGFLAVALLAAGAFVALNQAATAILGSPGRLASLAVLVLAAATGILSTLSGPRRLPAHARRRRRGDVVRCREGLFRDVRDAVPQYLVRPGSSLLAVTH